MINELIETESPNRWRLSIEYADFSEPLRKTIVIANVEVREQQISEVRYSRHEEYTRATSHGIWQAPVHAVHSGAEQLKDDLMRAATTALRRCRRAWHNLKFFHRDETEQAGAAPAAVKAAARGGAA